VILLALLLTASPDAGTACPQAKAKRMYAALEAPFRTYLALPLKDSPTLKVKTTALRDLQKRYEAVLQLRCANEVVGTLVKIGRLYEEFCAKLDALPAPAGLSPEQYEAFKKQLQSQGEGICDKATEYFRYAVEQASANGVTGEDVEYAKARLAQMVGTPPR
jgi:hypothetical protein